MIRSQSGFSLVELMTVIAIVGIVATMGMADYARFGIRAKYMRARAEMAGFSTVALGAKMSDEAFLWQITGNSCTGCGGDPTVTWQRLGESTPPKDPWGTVYILDENEGEFADCRKDWIFTAGMDKQFAGLVDPPQGDDVLMRVPYYASRPDCPGTDALGVGPDYNW